VVKEKYKSPPQATDVVPNITQPTSLPKYLKLNPTPTTKKQKPMMPTTVVPGTKTTSATTKTRPNTTNDITVDHSAIFLIVDFTIKILDFVFQPSKLL
jgi:hypothetical protein